MRPAGRSAKSVTRREVRSARRDRPASRTEHAGDGLAGRLPEVLALLPPDEETSRTVAVYVSLPGEPPTGPLRAALHRAGHRVLLPVLLADHDLDWVLDEDHDPVGQVHPAGPAGAVDPLRPGGVRLGRDAVATADLVLVPALAVDAAGTRLGQGGGSYDRALARLRATAAGPLVLAVVHDEEVLDDAVLPREAHDVPVHGALTPRGVRLLGAPAAPPPPARPPRA